MLRSQTASQSTSNPMRSNPLHPRTLNNKGKNMNQFLLVVSFLMYKFCILSQNIRICFTVRITFFTSERLNLHRFIIASSLFTGLPHHTCQVCGCPRESPHWQTGTQRPTERSWHVPEVTQRVSHSAEPGTSTRACLGSASHEDSASDTATPSSFLPLHVSRMLLL